MPNTNFSTSPTPPATPERLALIAALEAERDSRVLPQVPPAFAHPAGAISLAMGSGEATVSYVALARRHWPAVIRMLVDISDRTAPAPQAFLQEWWAADWLGYHVADALHLADWLANPGRVAPAHAADLIAQHFYGAGHLYARALYKTRGPQAVRKALAAMYNKIPAGARNALLDYHDALYGG